MKKKFSRDEILAMLKKHNGNVRQVAVEAGVPFKSIYRRLHAEGLFDELKLIRRDAEAEYIAQELERAQSEFRVALSHGNTSVMLKSTIAIVNLQDEAGVEMTQKGYGLYIARRMAQMAEQEEDA